MLGIAQEAKILRAEERKQAGQWQQAPVLGAGLRQGPAAGRRDPHPGSRAALGKGPPSELGIDRGVWCAAVLLCACLLHLPRAAHRCLRTSVLDWDFWLCFPCFMASNVYGAGSCTCVSCPLRRAKQSWCQAFSPSPECLWQRVSAQGCFAHFSTAPFFSKGNLSGLDFVFAWGFQSWAMGSLPGPRSYKCSATMDMVIPFLCELCIAEMLIISL